MRRRIKEFLEFILKENTIVQDRVFCDLDYPIKPDDLPLINIMMKEHITEQKLMSGSIYGSMRFCIQCYVPCMRDLDFLISQVEGIIVKSKCDLYKNIVIDSVEQEQTRGFEQNFVLGSLLITISLAQYSSNKT